MGERKVQNSESLLFDLPHSRASPLPHLIFSEHKFCVRKRFNVGAGLLAKRPAQATRYADLAMINPVSLAASNRIATNFDVGVWLPSPVLSSGTSGFTSG